MPTELPGRKAHRVPRAMATLTGLEPATSAVTGRRANQLRHRALLYCLLRVTASRYPLRDSNPRYRLERAAS
jgi:integrase